MATATPRGLSGGFFGDSSVELNTEKFYGELNTELTDSSRYSLHCNNIYVNNNKEEVKKICEKFLRHLEKSVVWKVEKPKYDFCMLLNYWIYDKLTGIYGDKNTSEDVNIAFANLQSIWEYTVNSSQNKIYYKNCKPEFNVVKHSDWKKRKEFYEYFVDYDLLSMMGKNFDDKCEYYKKIEAKKSLYKHFENECLSDASNCFKLYEKYIDYNPDKVLPTLQCHNKSVEEIPTETAHGAQQDLRQEQEPGDRASGSGVSRLTSGPGTEFPQENTDIGRKFGHSVLGVAPVLLTASALYRYTPVGSWIRKLGGYNSNGVSNMDEFSSYTQESSDMFSDNSASYISYKPI
ncbi:PIR Superfamily Protein [Plasmodium ovale wallikeri]|uniref:PIR Superfamily Protein n=1 Tax=Plasmodium ovale wallikeri TaxID=864142 RepID=A0A1A9AIP7_PLAOA|nr:PIR Superfamily Protein [Plasmodium ovale wallikeri]